MRGFVPFLALLAACAAPKRAPEYDRSLAPGEMALRKITDPARLPDFAAGWRSREAAIQAIDRSLEYLAKPSSKSHYPYLDVSHERVVASQRALREVLAKASSPADLHHRILEGFEVYESVGWDGEGTVLFTAYCEPIYEGSRTPTAEYRHPLYRLPPDLIKADNGTPVGRRMPDGRIGPYPTRREIEESGMLRGLELVYLKDPVEAFIIHVQGSARIRLPGGTEMRIGYAGKTDRPYTSVGRELIRDGLLPKNRLSLQGIKGLFKERPDLVRKYLYRNESYVFFTERNGGPYGSLNAPLTPLASIATDKSVFPRGAPAYVITQMPQASLSPEPFRAFVQDQDTGGAIRSAGRADIYYGSGPDAEARAGHTRSEGRLTYLFARTGQKSPAVLSSK